MMKDSWIKSISGIDLKITNAGEILRMAGPWAGDVYVRSNLISKDCLVDNIIYQEERNLLFFVKHHQVNLYQYFTINFFDLSTEINYEFTREFEMIYLKEFVSKNQLHVYLSFNDQSVNNWYFDLDKEDFYQV